MRPLRVLVPFAAAFFMGLHASAQAVISAHSGVVHFSEGSVLLDDQPLDHKFGSFPSIKDGSTLRTEKGRAEILLTPGVFLRMDENSAIRMRSGALTDTRLDFLQGSLIVDSLDALADNHVVIQYKDSEIRFPKQGVYRLDFETATVQAYSGEAEIAHDGKTSTIDDSHLFFLTLDLTTRKLDAGTEDEFYDWARERSNQISAENQLAAQSGGDPADQDADPNALAGPLPNYGLPAPGIGVPGIPSYPAPDYSYPVGSALFNPFGPYAAGFPYMPYTVFPVFVLVRPYYRSGQSRWPHATGSGTAPNWTGTRATWRSTHPGWSGTRSTWNGISHTPSQRLAFPSYRPTPAYRAMPAYRPLPAYRPMPSSVARPTYARPAVMPHPMAAPARAIGRR